MVLRQTPRWAQSLVVALILLGGGGIAASALIKIDEVITVSGTLKPIEGVYEVKTPAGGLIKNVYVEEGEIIKKGDILVRFDTRKAEQEIQNIDKQIKEIKVSRESSERAIESKLTSIRNSLATNEKILERMTTLNSVGAIEENALLKQKDKVFQLKAQIEEIKEERIQRESSFDRNLSDLNSRRQSNKIQKQYELVYAPKSGIIFENKAIEQGVLSGGELIMKIIPQNNLKGSVNITNREIGYVKIGQKAQVRVDSFDYTRFGYINGQIQSIGADAKQMGTEGQNEYKFPVTIKLENSYLETKGVKNVTI